MIWKQNTELSQYNLFRENGYSAFSAVALCKAGIKTLDEADDFLNGDELCDFRLIRNIDKATDIIWKHIFAHNRICIFGDYDADGISASAVMFLALKKLGAEVCVRLPDRIDEGYGISKKAIKEQAECGAKLFVTVDNGVRAVEETEYVKELGLDIVILDHHEPGDVLPQADALIDLHIEGETYPYKELTGSGLAWKVAHCMLEQIEEHDFALSLADIAAIGTIGDVAPLNGENRVIVKRAVKRMRDPYYDRPGIKALMGDMSHITAEDIAYRLAPCLNAAGRLNVKGAELSLILLLETNPLTAAELAVKVLSINEERKQMQTAAYGQIREEAEKLVNAGDKVLVLCTEKAPGGIVGLLAGNLKEEFGRPAIVFAFKTDKNGKTVLTGSARSVEAFHILNGIEKCRELLLSYGGHAMAAGLSLNPENFESFRRAINKTASSLTDEELQPTCFWDMQTEQSELSDELFAEAERLEPFGAGALKPVLKTEIKLSENEAHKFIGQDGKHIKLFADGFSLIGFNLAEKYMELSLPDKITAYATLGENYFNGEKHKQLSLLDFSA